MVGKVCNSVRQSAPPNVSKVFIEYFHQVRRY